jgi:hypothetical protein
MDFEATDGGCGEPIAHETVRKKWEVRNNNMLEAIKKCHAKPPRRKEKREESNK